jgi:hypothetical protein
MDNFLKRDACGEAEVVDEGGDVDEKSRARHNVKGGESNVRGEGRSEASGKRGGM